MSPTLVPTQTPTNTPTQDHGTMNGANGNGAGHYVGGYTRWNRDWPLISPTWLPSSTERENLAFVLKRPNLAELGAEAWVVPPALPPVPVQIEDRFRPLAAWDGVVISTSPTGFIARLTSQAGKEPPEEAEFDWDDVPPSDIGLVAEGAVFYWSIGYLTTASGQVSRASMLRFRRLPVWTREDLDEAWHAADRSAELLGWS